MARPLRYADAVRILGGDARPDLLSGLDDLTSGILLGGLVTGTAVLGWFDARADFARVSRSLVTTVSHRITGAHRLDRTERISAAHTVILVTAFFEAIAEARLPFDLADAALTRADQLRLLGPAAEPAQSLARSLVTAGAELPEAHGSHDDYLAQLRIYYAALTDELVDFLTGLHVWDQVPGRETVVRAEFGRCAERACTRYEALLDDLQVDCPEIALWVAKRDRRAVLQAVRPGLRELGAVLGELGRAVAALPRPRPVAAALARANEAELHRPIARSGDLPTGLDVPTLDAAYLPPAFRVAEPPPGGSAGVEEFWCGVPVRADLDRYLAGFLTSPRAQRAPLLVLGQPGAGKSVLTKILAARLPSDGFRPIRVPLRDVDSARDLQTQIEQAVRAATTEQAGWPELAEDAEGALPVLLLDGFDELLQATGLSQSDYLEKVAAFQQRELDLGRAVAVVVTTRTSVADRAVAPPGALLLRLEPFDRERVTAWLRIWNGANASYFRRHGLRPLPPAAVLAHAELASQPLLLLMLALYDVDANALQQRESAELSSQQLYERLLIRFAEREVDKDRRRGTPGAVEEELYSLAVVAFGMHNRSAQWITEADLNADLEALLGERPPAGDELDAAGTVVGRFFFVHRSQAIRAGAGLRTYEFLHATFSEYLVARLTWRLLGQAVARDAVVPARRGEADPGELGALLSFVPLSMRASILRFLQDLAGESTAADRAARLAFLGRLYRHSRSDGWSVAPANYRPARLPVPARNAVYVANLVLLAIAVAEGGLGFGEFRGPAADAPGETWHREALLWHSQMTTDGWETLMAVLAVERIRGAGHQPDVRLTLDYGRKTAPAADFGWFLDFLDPADSPRSAAFVVSQRLSAIEWQSYFQGSLRDELVRHVLGPLLESDVADTVRLFRTDETGVPTSAAQALLAVLLLPGATVDAARRQSTYLRCADIAADWRLWARTPRSGMESYQNHLCAALAGDPAVSLGLAAEVLDRLDPVLSATSFQAAAAAVLARAYGDEHAPVIRHVVRELSSDFRLDDPELLALVMEIRRPEV